MSCDHKKCQPESNIGSMGMKVKVWRWKFKPGNNIVRVWLWGPNVKVWKWNCESVKKKLCKWKCESVKVKKLKCESVKVNVWKCESETAKVGKWKYESESEYMKVKMWNCQPESNIGEHGYDWKAPAQRFQPEKPAVLIQQCPHLTIFVTVFKFAQKTSLLFGMDDPTKTDEFLEKFQTAFDPPPSFSENHVALFFQNTWPKKRL